MTIKPHIHARIAGVIIAAASAFALASCQDDPLMPSGDGMTTVSGEKMEKPFLTFDIYADDLGNTVGGNHFTAPLYGEYYENYIDPTKFRVLFFTGEVRNGYPDPLEDVIDLGSGVENHGNKFLFEVDQRHISAFKHNDHLAFDGIGEMQGYRITISERDLFEQKDQEITVNNVKKTIPGSVINDVVRKAILGEKDSNGNYIGNGFKIVVLANTPRTVEGFRNYDPFTDDPIMEDIGYVSTEDLHINFGDDLSELSQCIYDNVYGDRNSRDLKTGRLRNVTFKHLQYDDPSNLEEFSLGGRMGIYSVWVNNYFYNFHEVNNFLRDPSTPSGVEMSDGVGMTVKFTYDAGFDGDTFKYTPYSYYRCFDTTYKDRNSYTFENVWRVWNFSAGAKTGGVYSDNAGEEEDTYGYHTSNADVAEYWRMRDTYSVIPKLKAKQTDVDGLSINYGTTDKPIATFDEANGRIRLATTVSSSDAIPTDTDLGEAIKLTVYGEGTLRIKATKASATGNGRLMVTGKTNGQRAKEPLKHIDEHGVETDETYFDPGATLADNMYHPEDGGYGWDYIIEPNSQSSIDIYIHAKNGSIDIYEIEFVRDRHLYDTGRRARMPSLEYPIPMYGCQEFDPIGQYVENMLKYTDNGIFNSSDHSANIAKADENHQYKYKRVYLLRSLAKVELYFKKSVFKDHMPNHIYMRTFNRSARMEPKDVLTPTDVIWFGSQYMDDNAAIIQPGYRGPADYYTSRYAPTIFQGIDVENQNIHEFGAMRQQKDLGNGTKRDYDENNIEDYLPDYYDKTAWYFGCWQEWRSKRKPNGWDWNEGEQLLDKDKKVEYTIPKINPDRFGKGLNYPRVFNSRVDRSDFCRMMYVGEKNGYYKYIIYVPEKNLDDADSKGVMSKDAKVAHIEMRFDKMNEGTNMDDERIYRIYFADYKNTDINEITRDLWDNYEKKNTNGFLDNYLYPIIRNHVYQFYVNSINGNMLGVDSSVSGPENRSTFGNITFN